MVTKSDVYRPASAIQTDGNRLAFGESLGIAVPTRYTEEIHEMVNLLLAADATISPMIMGLSGRTVWLSRIMAGVLLVFRNNISDLTLRRRLEVEAALGALLVIVALRATITHRIFDNLYLLFSGVLMIGNALMTESE